MQAISSPAVHYASLPSTIMELHLMQDSIMHTHLVDNSGRVVYSTHTPSSLFGNTTTVRRQSQDGMRDIAKIRWHSWRNTTLVYCGATYDLKNFLTKKWWRSDRTFIGPDGRKYTWKCRSSKEELRSESGQMVARYKGRNTFKGRKPTLSIEGSAMHMSDLIVLTWLYIEWTRRRKNSSAAGAGAGAAASASGGSGC